MEVGDDTLATVMTRATGIGGSIAPNGVGLTATSGVLEYTLNFVMLCTKEGDARREPLSFGKYMIGSFKRKSYSSTNSFESTRTSLSSGREAKPMTTYTALEE